MAAGAIQLDAGEVFVCAGVESMTRVPIGGFNSDAEPAPRGGVPAGLHEHGRDRRERRHAVPDHPRRPGGVRRPEPRARRPRPRPRAGSPTRSCRSGATARSIEQDGCIRPDTSQEALAGLKPAFDEHGTVTAGTSSPLTDGAAAVLVCTEDYAEKHGLDVLARIRSIAVAGCAGRDHGHRPGRGDAQGAGARRARDRRHRAGRAQRGVRLAGDRLRARPGDRPRDRSTSTAARSRSAIRSAPPARGSPARRRRCCSATAGATALATQCIGGGQGIATVLEAV